MLVVPYANELLDIAVVGVALAKPFGRNLPLEADTESSIWTSP